MRLHATPPGKQATTQPRSKRFVSQSGKELQPQLEATLNLRLQTMQMGLTTSMVGGDIAPGVKDKEVRGGFGNLVISQTAAYGCRLLFKELKGVVV